MTVRNKEFLLLWLILLAALVGKAQDLSDDPAKDEAQTQEMRTLQVRVTDKHNHAMEGLRKVDFHLWDNGNERQIVSCQENRNPEQLKVILVLDQLHTSADELEGVPSELRTLLAGKGTQNLSVYLINPTGTLLPILGVTDPKNGRMSPNQFVGSLHTELTRTFPLQADLQHDPGRRFDKAVLCLHSVLQDLAKIPGRSAIIWVAQTLGIANYEEEGRKLGSDVNQGKGPLYVLRKGSLDAANEFSGATSLTGGAVITNTSIEKALKQVRDDYLSSYTLGYEEPAAARQNDLHSVRVLTSHAEARLRYGRLYFASRP